MAAPAQRTSVYVGDLPVDLPRAEDALNSLFSSIAPVISVKVCRDMATQRSLGYGYVNFQTSADAEKAIDALNYSEILPHRQIRVMFAIRDPLQRKSGVNNVFVKKLDASINAKALQNAFTECGRVLSCKVALDAEGNSKCYGFVQFETAEGAKAALKLNGRKIGDSDVIVAPFIRRIDREATLLKSFTNIYVKNIKASATEEDVKAAFQECGEIESLFLTGCAPFPTKFALIVYKEHEAAVKAIEALNDSKATPLTSEDTKLLVCRAVSKAERQREKKKAVSLYQNNGRNLYVKHLPDDITEDKLREVFSAFGTITSCALMKDPTGTVRGFAFVCFNEKEQAMEAMHTLNGKPLAGSRKPLYVSQAEQKDMRLRLLHQRRLAMRREHHMMPPMGMFPQQWSMPPYPPMNPPMMPPPPNMNVPQFMSGPMMRRPMMQHQQMPPQNRYTQPREMMPPVRYGGVDMNYLGTLAPEQQKNYLGEMLYSRISNVDPANAAKVTGMLLEMSREEIFEVLENHSALVGKIKEANSVLQQHSAN